MLVASKEGLLGRLNSCPVPPANRAFVGAQVELPNPWIFQKRPET